MSRAKRDPPPHEPATLEEKVEEIHRRLVRDKSSELFGVLEILGNRRKMMWINFNAGLARGVGFFLGVTLVGALLLGALAFAFNLVVHHLGYDDLSFEQLVRAAVVKFEEVQEIVVETQAEVEAAQAPHVPTDPAAPGELPPAFPPQPEAPR